MLWLANVVNISLLIIIGALLLEYGPPHDIGEISFVALCALAPTVSLWCINIHSAARSPGLIRLFLQRKALEEQVKIAGLKRSISSAEAASSEQASGT